jgi:cell shape-determining protein MreC
MADKDFVRPLKEELEEKLRKCDKLESENQALKRSLETKVWLYKYLLYSYSFFYL